MNASKHKTPLWVKLWMLTSLPVAAALTSGLLLALPLPRFQQAWLAVAEFIVGGLMDGLGALGATQQVAWIIIFAAGTLWLCVTMMLAWLYGPEEKREPQ